MKSLLILVLILGLAAALFFTRPTRDDFEKYIRQQTTVVDGKPTGGQSLQDKILHQMRTFANDQGITESPADHYLKQCTYANCFLWTNVSKDGQVIYTGILGHWFERKPDAGKIVPSPPVAA